MINNWKVFIFGVMVFGDIYIVSKRYVRMRDYVLVDGCFCSKDVLVYEGIDFGNVFYDFGEGNVRGFRVCCFEYNNN